MNLTRRQRLRRLRFFIGGLIAVGMIALAVLIGLVQVLLPMAAHYPNRIATMISERLHQPVRFASVDGHWQASGPLLVLHDVQIGGQHGGTPLQLPVAEVKLDFGALLVPSRRLVNLRLVDLNLDLRRAADGAWSVGGIGAAGGTSSQRLDLGQLPGSLSLDRLRMDIHDARSGKDWRLWSDTLQVSNDGTVLRFAGNLRRPDVTSGLAVIGHVNMDDDNGTIYVGGKDIDLGRLMHGIDARGYGIDSGKGRLQAWLEWRQARVVAQTVRLDLTGLSLHGPLGRSRVAHVQGLFGFRRQADGWSVRFASDDGGKARVEYSGTGGAGTLWAGARHLDMAQLLPLVAQVPGLPAGLSRWLIASRPHGMVDDAALRWSAEDGLQHVDATFQGLQLDPDGARPGVNALDGRVYGDHEAVALTLPAQATVIRMPRTFRKPITLKRLAGDVVAWHDGDAWHIGTAGLALDGDGFGANARGQVRVADGGGKPFIDMYVDVDHATVPAAKQFWPIDALSPKTVAWLDRSLVDGKLVQAQALIRGDMADWPFHHHEGRFEARGEVDDVTLDYGKDWPDAKGIHGIASFVNDGMLVTADAGTSMGNKASLAVASIPTFHGAQLILTVQGSGTGQSMLDFARHSPIADRQAKVLSDLRLGGKGQFGFSLVLPLAHAENFMLAGSAQVNSVNVDNADWGLHLGKLTGELHFDGRSLHGRGLNVRYNGVPSTIDLDFGQTAQGKDDHPVSVTVHGHYDVPTLIKGRDALAPLGKLAQGSSDFDIGYDIRMDAGDHAQQTLQVDSNLKGIALDLPSPLDKKPDDLLSLHTTLQLPVSGGDLRVSLGNLVQAHARLPVDNGAPLALAVKLGATAPDTLPARGIRIQGTAATMDVSGWLQRAVAQSQTSGKDGPQLDSVDVTAAKAHVFGAVFDHLRVRLTPQAGQIFMQVDGPQAKGSLTMPTTELLKRGVLARMDRLYWPDETAAQTRAELESPASAPASAGSASPPVDYADTGIAPASLPPLHISVGDLRLGKARLGQARFESWPTADGMHIDQLRTRTNDVQIMASGEWNGTATDSHTHMNIDFQAENLGSLLNTLGFGGLFDGGRTSAHLEASWPGEPSSLAMQRMTGTLAVEVSKGRIPDVQPGVGRLLGLMALTELPRRLSLDFGDVFGKGMSFDSIKGNFHLDDGVARTDNLKLKGSAAEISITGQTDMRNKTYDQRILVVPHVGNSLPVVGALTAGPVGAAAGLAIQGLLGRGLNKAASARYSLTGSWEKPKITLLEKGKPPPTPAPEAPPELTTLPATDGSAPATTAPAETVPPPASPSPAHTGTSAPGTARTG